MKPIRLSICIPTYNFGRFIGETLKSVIDQSTDEVDIVVVDGASTDNTADVVRGFQKEFPRLAYHRLPAKGGIDKDLATTVSLATGDYCWLLSSDDVLKPGAIRRVLEEIRSGCEIYLCNRIECDRGLVPFREARWLDPRIGDRAFRFPSISSWTDYLRSVRSLGALFSYISTILVQKKAWDPSTAGDPFIGTNYAHVPRLLSILQGGGGLGYIRDALVLCRGENDSFRDQGVIRRYLIDFNGYDRMATALFSDAAVRRAFRDVVRREHRWYLLTQVRYAAATGRQSWPEIERLLRSFGYPDRELFLIDALGSSRIAMGIAFPLRRAFKRLRSWFARPVSTPSR